MLRLRERFRGSQQIRELAEFFIRIDQIEMEQIAEETENDRRTLEEIAGI